MSGPRDYWITTALGAQKLCLSGAGVMDAVFALLREMRDTSPYWKLKIDELAEEIWPEINQKER